MYFCYIDESGDGGAYLVNKPERSGSKYFILVGVLVAAAQWKNALGILKGFRKRIAKEGYLPYDIEFHCAEMIDPRKVNEFKQIGVSDRWKLIKDYSETLGQETGINIICIVIDKSKSEIPSGEYLTVAITKLYQAFNEFLKINQSNGIVFFDRSNEKLINTNVRKLLGTGANGEDIPGVKIDRILEDPIFRVSSESIFVQSADVVAYALKEKEFPQASRKKFNADMIFQNKLASLCFVSQLADKDGIIRA